MEGLDGIEKRHRTMSALRENPPFIIGEAKVVKVGDYIAGSVVQLESGKSEPTGQPKSDVLCYTLDTDDKIIIRPSGTEPKIKIYILLHAESKSEINKKAETYEDCVKKIMGI